MGRAPVRGVEREPDSGANADDSCTPPPADLAIAVLVVVDHVPGGPGAGSVLVGSRSLPLVAGANIVGDVLTTAAQIKIKAGNSFGTQNSSFTGTIYTMPFPG